MFMAALFIIARTWKQPRCPSADECIRKLWYTYTLEYYSVIKKNIFESIPLSFPTSVLVLLFSAMIAFMLLLFLLQQLVFCSQTDWLYFNLCTDFHCKNSFLLYRFSFLSWSYISPIIKINSLQCWGSNSSCFLEKSIGGQFYFFSFIL